MPRPFAPVVPYFFHFTPVVPYFFTVIPFASITTPDPAMCFETDPSVYTYLFIVFVFKLFFESCSDFSCQIASFYHSGHSPIDNGSWLIPVTLCAATTVGIF